MRRSSRGILAINIALSLSHCPETGITYAMLLGRSPMQAAYITQRIIDLAPVAHHPAFLPTLICTFHRNLLRRLCDKANDDLFGVEMDSGQTWAPVVGWRPQGMRPNDMEITKRVLGVIQLTTAWEPYSKALLSDIESIQEFIEHVNGITPAPRSMLVAAEGRILHERLSFLARKSSLMLWRFGYVKQRAQAQQAAVRLSQINEDKIANHHHRCITFLP